MSSETIQYRLNLSNALHAISPALSALHTSRAAALHPEAFTILHPSHCPKCGTYHFSGDHPPTRKKRKRATASRSKSLQRKCHLCGFSIDALPPNNTSLPIQLPSDLSRTGTAQVTNKIGQEPPSTDTVHPVAATVPTTTRAPVPSLPGRQSHPKSNHTKTSALKDMLSRNRQREESVSAHKKRKEGHEGLAAFLKEL